eukprot:COSAG01_NODE_36314_length_519_cov_1.371429_2_plen_41_part_01
MLVSLGATNVGIGHPNVRAHAARAGTAGELEIQTLTQVLAF